ncbi:MAG: DUF3943 domain-containing protein [Candidatus Aminicenantes bacterium]|nr:DUF3943 domain-containing protein [Candidatus Aminicenantes bacterium]
MRKIALIIFLFIPTLLCAGTAKPKIFPYISYPRDYCDPQSFSLNPFPKNNLHTEITTRFTSSTIPNSELHSSSSLLKSLYSQFSLYSHRPTPFDFELPPYKSPDNDLRTTYSQALIEISGINLAVWSFDKFILKKNWAQISIHSIYDNLDNGFVWDRGTFISNQLAHPYHGAIYFSAARLNGLNPLESTLFTALGSLMWESFFELNYPSINDTLMTTLGGIILGGPLHQIGNMMRIHHTGGFFGLLQKPMMVLINPSFGFSLFSDKHPGLSLFSEIHHYSFRLPFGTYWSPNNHQKFMVGLQIENRDYIEKNLTEINPYDWFLLDFRLGLSQERPWDKEILTTVMLSGYKTKSGLSGVFGVYDYIDTQVIDRVSAAGIGFGAISNYHSEPDFFTKTSGVISFILGGSTPSSDIEKCHFGQIDQNPYYFGPGMMSRFRIEVGKKNIGSLLAKFSHYWINSLFSEAQESLSVSSFNLRLNLTKNSQINLGYDCYIRQGTVSKKNHAATHGAAKIFYLYNF